MDLNRKYADHQKALINASAATSDEARTDHLTSASEIASQIKDYQIKLGAAASCAWSSSKMGYEARKPSAPEGTGDE